MAHQPASLAGCCAYKYLPQLRTSVRFLNYLCYNHATMNEYYFTKEDLEALKKVTTYQQMFEIAKVILKRIPKPVIQLCGPISTGGAGSVEKNMERMNTVVKYLQKQGKNVFNQLPFEEPMQKVISLRKEKHYDMSLLNEFYKPIFEQGLLDILCFLPDWESSVGARWEHDQALRLGLKIEYVLESEINS